MTLALWAGWRRLQEGGRRAPPPLTISTSLSPPNPVGILALPRALILASGGRTGACHEESASGLRQVKDGNLILIGTIPVPHSKYKPSPRERENRRHLVRQGATIFKKELVN